MSISIDNKKLGKITQDIIICDHYTCMAMTTAYSGDVVIAVHHTTQF